MTDNPTEPKDIEPTTDPDAPPPIWFGLTAAQRIWVFTQSFAGVTKGKTATIKNYSYTYFDIDDVYAAAIPVMSECGLGAVDRIDTIMIPEGVQPALRVKVFCLDSPDDFEESIIPIPSGDVGTALGSALTYLRRYSLVTMLNIRVPGDDDDGLQADLERHQNSAGSAEGKPLEEIHALLEKIDDGSSRALEYIGKQWGLTSLGELSLKEAASLKRTLKGLLKKQESDGAA